MSPSLELRVGWDQLCHKPDPREKFDFPQTKTEQMPGRQKQQMKIMNNLVPLGRNLSDLAGFQAAHLAKWKGTDKKKKKPQNNKTVSAQGVQGAQHFIEGKFNNCSSVRPFSSSPLLVHWAFLCCHLTDNYFLSKI